MQYLHLFDYVQIPACICVFFRSFNKIRINELQFYFLDFGKIMMNIEKRHLIKETLI